MHDVGDLCDAPCLLALQVADEVPARFPAEFREARCFALEFAHAILAELVGSQLVEREGRVRVDRLADGEQLHIVSRATGGDAGGVESSAHGAPGLSEGAGHDGGG